MNFEKLEPKKLIKILIKISLKKSANDTKISIIVSLKIRLKKFKSKLYIIRNLIIEMFPYIKKCNSFPTKEEQHSHLK